MRHKRRGVDIPKVLIVYPHGLGDCILATPAIREYKKQTGNFIGFATLERFRSAELFKHNPYVDEIVYTKDAWNDFPNFRVGKEAVETFCWEYAKEHKYDEIKMIDHSPDGSKILDCFKILRRGLPIEESSESDVLPYYHTEVYLTDEDREWAENTIKGIGGDSSQLGFIHSETGVPSKDLPRRYGIDWIAKKFGSIPWFEAVKAQPITNAFALLKRATAICVTDSVYYHAAGAMDKDIDLAYFARGPQVYHRVKPLHKVKQNIVYELEDICVSS